MARSHFIAEFATPAGLLSIRCARVQKLMILTVSLIFSFLIADICSNGLCMRLQSLRQHKIATFLVSLLVIILVAIACVIFFSESLVRWGIVTKGSEALGREVAIDGDLNIDWHWTYTAVSIEQLRVENAEGFPEPDMVSIEDLDFTFKPLKLLVGKLEFGEISVVKPYIFLERKTAEEANWNFSPAKQEDENDATPDDRHEFPVIDRLELTDGKLVYRDATKDINLDLELNTVSGEGGEKGELTDFERGFEIVGKGAMQGENFEIEAAGASLETLRDTTKRFPLYLKIVMGPTEASSNGTFEDPVKMAGIDATLLVSGDNMADLFYLTSIPLPPTPPYNIEGQLTKEGDVWSYKDFKGEVGGSDLSGSLSYNTGGERGFLQANLVSNVLDSEDLGGFIGLPPNGEHAAPEQQEAAARKEASPYVVPDVPLELERLRATDLDVSLQAKKIEAPGLPFKGMDVRFDLRNGILKLDPLNVVLADGSLDGKIEIDAQQDIPPVGIDLNLRNLSLEQFFKGTRFEETTQGIFGGKVTLAGAGASLAEVLASSDGKLAIIMSGGKISLLLVEASDLDIGQALPLFFGKDKSTRIRCAVADFDVVDGLLSSRTFLVDTEDSLLSGAMKIDMNNEVISAKLDAKPKDGSLLSAQTPITVSGTLKAPEVGLEGKKVLTQGALSVALGTLLTPFAAILPFIEAGDDRAADCQALINKAES